jgi:hypothetical protein
MANAAEALNVMILKEPALVQNAAERRAVDQPHPFLDMLGP